MGIVYKNTSSGMMDFGQEAGGLYSVKNLMYPENLENSPEYGGHKVVFFINVPGNSKLATSTDDSSEFGTMNMPSGANRYYVPVGNKTRTAIGQVGSAASTATNNTQDWVVGKVASLPGGEMILSADDAVGGAVGSAVGAVGGLAKQGADALGITRVASDAAKVIKGITKQPKRLTSAIVLHMPTALMNTYNVNWSEADLFTGAVIETMAQGVGNTAASAVSPNESARDTVATGYEGIAKPALSAIAASVLKGMDYAQRATQITPGDSKMEQLFKSVDFRRFTFDYQFSPKTQTEARAVLNIIRMFRHHMLPEYFDTNNFMYIYPSEFEIRYYMKDKENDKLERQITAVLTSMNVNHSPNGVFTTFPDGTPTQINVTLSFLELAVPTKETSPANATGV